MSVVDVEPGAAAASPPAPRADPRLPGQIDETARGVGELAGDEPVCGERLRCKGEDVVLLGYACAWLVYVITGFRMPWTPLVHESAMAADGGGHGGGAPAGSNAIRQLFLTGGAMLGIRRMVITRSLNQILGMHLGLLLLGVVLVVSLAYSTDKTLTIKRSMVYWFGFLFLVAAVHASERPLQFFQKAVVLSTGWVAFASIATFFVFPKSHSTLPFRPGLAGLSGHPNTIGPCLYIATVIGLGMATRKGFERAHYGFCMAMLVVALFMSNSVTSILSMIAGVGIWVMLTTTSYRAGLLAIAGVVFAGVVQFIGVKTIKSAFFAAAGRDESMSGRDTLWSDVFNEGMKSPVFGAGYGAFWYPHRGREITGTWDPQQSHNAYIDVFVDLGVLGVLLVLVVVHFALLTGWLRHAGERGTRQRNAVAAIVAMGVSLLFIGAFGESFIPKMDKYQFFALAWSVMLLGNLDCNHISAEGVQLERDYPMVRGREVRTRLGHVELHRA